MGKVRGRAARMEGLVYAFELFYSCNISFSITIGPDTLVLAAPIMTHVRALSGSK